MEIEKLKPGELKDVIAIRDKKDWFKRTTNIEMVIRDAEDFEWGYVGAGPHNFALNILMHFTGGDERFSRNSVYDFRDQIVAKIRGFKVKFKAKKILSWIEDRRKISADGFIIGKAAAVTG